MVCRKTALASYKTLNKKKINIKNLLKRKEAKKRKKKAG